MGKDDVGPIGAFGELISHFAGEQARQSVLAGFELVAEMSAEELATWLRGAVDKLDAEVNESTQTRIMENLGFQCAEMNRSHIDEALARRSQFDSLEAFLDEEERNPSRGTKLAREGNTVIQCYDPRGGYGVRCFCSLWRGLPAGSDASATWCQCSKGFVTKLWEAYVGQPVSVELEGSCIAGANECRFRIHLPL